MAHLRLRSGNCLYFDALSDGDGKRWHALKKALNLKPQEIVKRLGGLPALKFHCSVLGHASLKEAINDYLKNKEAK